jgi:hypothetical protein
MSKSHNKKRNVGLVYEFLVRYVSRSLVEGRSDDAQKAVSILNRRFKPGTQLYNEFRLFNSLLVTHVSSGNVVNSILSEAKHATRRLNIKQLDNEKSKLIREINHTLQDPNFFNQSLTDYKMYATIQSLLKDWRSSTPDIAKVAVLEDNLTEWILTKKQGIKDLESQKSKDVNDTIISVMSEKISKKYHGVLNDSQQDLIKEYVISIDGNNDKLSSAMSDIRATTQSSIKNYMSSNSDSFINEKFDNVLKIISSSDINMINDVNISHHLSFLKLVEEIAV